MRLSFFRVNTKERANSRSLSEKKKEIEITQFDNLRKYTILIKSININFLIQFTE